VTSHKRSAWRDALPRVPLFLIVALTIWHSSSVFAAEVIPPKPDGYFNDYADVISKAQADALNHKLAEFERETSNQLLVVVFPKMQSDSDVADYTRRVAQTWGVGQKEQRNGAVLFVFVQDRKMWIQAGYGLEGVLPDAVCFDIYDNVIRPKFKAGDYSGGLNGGIDAIIAAARGEYKGTGKTVLQRHGSNPSPLPLFIFFIIFVIVLIRIIHVQRKGGYGYSGFGGPFIGGSGGGWSSGGGASSSGWSGGDGFMGGGGSFGGGGAGGSW
jgi:uncharacterized protein